MSDYVPSLPGLEKRRSTGTSDALQYYWSASAGERSSSFSSSLGISPTIESSPRPGILGSPYTLSPNPPLHETKSSISLRELVEQEAQHERRSGGSNSNSMGEPPKILEEDPRDSYPSNMLRNPDMASSTGPSNRRIHLVSYSSDSMSALASQPSIPSSMHDITPPSPSSSHSADSEYSLVEDEPAPHLSAPPPRDASTVRMSRANQGNRRGLVDADGNLGALFDRPSYGPPTPLERSWESPTPISPAIVSPEDVWRTPTQSNMMERAQQQKSIAGGWSAPGSPHGDNDRTPRNSLPGVNRSDKKVDKMLAQQGGRLLFVAPPDVSRRSLDELQRDISGLGLESRGTRPRIGLSVNSSVSLAMSSDEPDTPHSAPAHKTSFDALDIGGDTKGRVRPTSLLPPVSPLKTSSQQSFPPYNNNNNNRLTPTRNRSDSPSVSPSRSPEPPPKSELRRATPTPTPPPKGPSTSALMASPTPDNISAQTTPPLPTIINTPHTPEPPNRASTAPPASHGDVSPRSRSSTPPKPISKSRTIQDLTNLLGGAIDEIGLMDSRDVPPPTIGEPAKGKAGNHLILPPPRSTSANTSSASTMSTLSSEPASLSPTGSGFSVPSYHRSPGSQGSIGLGIVGSAMATAATTSRANVSRHVRKASSILSLRSSNYSAGSPTVPTFSSASASLPSAVLYGNIKALKTSGERARAYARSITELARADSGLRELCINIQTRSGPLSRSQKQGVMNQLGLGTAGGGSLPPPPGVRNVSGGSEFPMRPEAYSAREIAARTLEPADEPGALPPNLPYPALQLAAGGAVKASGSMQSLASVASSRRPGFFGRFKKEKENTSLGPPTGSLLNLTPAASASKRDLNASTTSVSRRNSAEVDSDHTFRVQPSQPSPRGPRGPSENNSPAHPSHRSSLEAPRPIMTHQPGRASMDSGSPRTSGGRLGLSGPRPLPTAGGGAANTPSPLARNGGFQLLEEDVRQFSDMIPHAERPVVRAYLQRYGEMSFAMTAYLEDEKKGTLMRA